MAQLGRDHDAPELVAAGLFLDSYLTNLDAQGATDYPDLIRRATLEAEVHRAELRARLGLAEDPDFDAQMSPAQWPALKDKLAAIFKTKTRADWDALLEHSDVCYAPVLTMSEAREHPHNSARQTFVEVAGTPQPAPAPRYSGTATATPSPAPMPGDDTADILAELGLSEGEIAEFRQAGAVS